MVTYRLLLVDGVPTVCSSGICLHEAHSMSGLGILIHDFWRMSSVLVFGYLGAPGESLLLGIDVRTVSRARLSSFQMIQLTDGWSCQRTFL